MAEVLDELQENGASNELIVCEPCVAVRNSTEYDLADWANCGNATNLVRPAEEHGTTAGSSDSVFVPLFLLCSMCMCQAVPIADTVDASRVNHKHRLDGPLVD